MSYYPSVGSSRKLPENPSLEYLRKQSKARLRELRLSRPTVKLSEAQHQIAQEYGFSSWPKLKASIGSAPTTGTLDDAVRALREGRCVILFDDAGHENEGDFVLAAEKVSPKLVNFMVRNGGGTLCLALPPTQIDRLGLSLINRERTTIREPAFTAGIDAAAGVTTGVSANDRSVTILATIQPDAKPTSIKTPGHVFPLRAEAGGLAARQGHTEGAIELMRRAGLKPAAVIIEILNDDGSMARLPDVSAVSAKHGVPVVKMSELLQ